MATSPPDPWSRYGWLVWGVWLLFLGFPLASSVGATSSVERVVGVSLTLAFAVVYLVTSRWLFAADRWRRAAPAGMAVASLLALGTVPVIGGDALSFLPFLAAIGSFALPRPACWWWVGATFLVPFAAPLDEPVEARITFTIILLAVGGGTAAGRLMSEHAQTVEQLDRELAVTAERERVARDVHDVLGHSLTVVAVKAELAERLLDVDPERARAELVQLRELTRQSLAEVRATVGGLRAARLDDELNSSRRALGDAGVRVVVHGDPSELDPRHRAVAGWVVREAVTNVLRHAGAQRCEIGVADERVWVHDDGVGFAGVQGNGLRGLAERVADSGGALTTTRATDGGTRLEASW